MLSPSDTEPPERLVAGDSARILEAVAQSGQGRARHPKEMPSTLETAPSLALELCRAANERLLATVEPIDEDQVRAASQLPGWTVAHVLTHLARNADGHVRRLEAALRGADVPRYPGGAAQRDGDIEEGARRPVAQIVADVAAAQRALDAAWDRSVAAGWPHSELRGDDQWPTTASPVRRLREVEMHHVDLGLGYEPSDWSEGYVAWELPALLATVASRIHAVDDVRALVAWLAGRRPLPSGVDLAPW